jgi:hypothetical protein
MQFFKLASCIIILFAVSATSVSAQPATKKSDIIDFSKSGETSSVDTTASNATDEGKNAIWFDGLSTLIGYASLSYEREIGKSFTIEAGGGVTFHEILQLIGTNPLLNIFQPEITYDGDAYWQSRGGVLVKSTGLSYDKNQSILLNSKQDNGYSFTQRLGTYLFLEPKFFPDQDPFEGFFYSTRIQYIKQNYISQKPDLSYNSGYIDYSPTETITTSNELFDIIPQIGMHTPRGNVLFCYAIGCGVRFQRYNGYDIGQILTPAGYAYELRSGMEKSVVTPVLNISAKIGYNF